MEKSGFITKLNPGLRISPNREFFEMLPWDAYDMLYAIAQMHDRADKLKRNDANPSGQDAQNDSDYSVEALFPVHSAIRSLYEKLKNVIMSIDSSLEEAPRLNYVTYKLGKRNTVSLWPKSSWILHCRMQSLRHGRCPVRRYREWLPPMKGLRSDTGRLCRTTPHQ